MVQRTLEGKVALVTGAGRGIGRAIAVALASGGARVALLARSQDELDQVGQEIQDLGGTAIVTRADVRDFDEVRAAVRAVADKLGAVDVLVNNAGVVWPLAPTTRVDPAEWTAAIGINLIGVFAVTHAVLPSMLNRGWGRIVNISSTQASRPTGLIGGNAYVTSKVALEAHTLNLAAELSETGVTVNVYRPGAVETSMHSWIRSQPPEEIGPALHEAFVRLHDERRLISPRQSADVLLSRLASDATGQIWSVHDT
jgi:3-oxoacyl-[acyl-carrier protein] reductase